MKQNSNKDMTDKTPTMTASPTNTVAALNAGDRMEAKLSSCPMQTTSSAGWLELELELSLL
jgi:hypothetical protein